MRAQSSGPEAQQALGQLIQRYERSVVAIIRAAGHPPGLTPEDLKQEFFLGVVRRRDVMKLDRERGRFRHWLHRSVCNFMKNVWVNWHGGRRGQSLTTPMLFDVEHGTTPEQQFMRQFAEDTVLHALQRQREEARDKDRFERWVRFLPGPQLDVCDLAPLAKAFGMSRNHVAVQIHTMRERHKRVLRELIADTLDVDPSTPEGARAVVLELQELYRLLAETPRTQVVLEDA